MSLADKLHQVGIGPEALVHAVEINHVITAVRPPRHIHRIEPDGIHANGFDIIQTGYDTSDIPYPVAVSILI